MENSEQSCRTRGGKVENSEQSCRTRGGKVEVSKQSCRTGGGKVEISEQSCRTRGGAVVQFPRNWCDPCAKSPLLGGGVARRVQHLYRLA